MEFLFAFVFLVIFIIAIVVIFYNKIIRLKVQVKEGWSDIQVQLKRRHNLIGNLVETVKGYASHEKETLEKVVQARTVAEKAEGQDMASVQTAERGLSTALQGLKIHALSEAYPDLKANTNFSQLQAELADTENKISASRRFYNTTVMALNTFIQQFPGSLFAGMAGATKVEFFELEEDEKEEVKKVPEVSFKSTQPEQKVRTTTPTPLSAPAPEPETETPAGTSAPISIPTPDSENQSAPITEEKSENSTSITNSEPDPAESTVSKEEKKSE